jgi:hypothetical protein
MQKPRLISVLPAWGTAPHSAFTDLLRFHARWLCAFREGNAHAGDKGKIRIIVSGNGTGWASAALVSERGVDLRDPKLSVMPDGRLMLLAGGTEERPDGTLGRQPRVWFSADGRAWTPPRRILSPGDWLWRVTWNGSRAYGVSYTLASARHWDITLYASDDGVEYRKVCALAVPGKPNEATLRFARDGRAVLLVRREGGDGAGWVGQSRAPYREWKWRSLGRRVGGPNFLILPDGGMWAVCRDYEEERHRVVVARMGPASYRPLLELPSGGDCSYAGLAWHGGRLWVSYYSSHEGRARIYLARVALTPAGRAPGPRPSSSRPAPSRTHASARR